VFPANGGELQVKDEKGRFKKGHSGNPKGKPRGTLHRATQAALNLLDGEAEALSRKAVELALEGDTTALRLCLERIAPHMRERPLSGVELPEISNPGDILDAISEVGQQLAHGDILPSQAAALCHVFEQYRRHFETTELEERIGELEKLISTK
tara:strand:+ start:2277 stop:2735 length:459 start_codon:yes stop_codon:yes gene_type:complete